MNVRLKPPIWRHDAYTLRALKKALTGHLTTLIDKGTLKAQRSTVIDMGAGDAPYRSLFAPHCKIYLACDLEPGPGIDLILKPGTPLPLDAGVADCVLSIQVLEHVWDIDTYLAECRRILAPQGCLLLSTHGTWLYHPHPTDYRRWTRDGLCRELQERGFEVLGMTPVVGPLAWTTQFRTLAYCHVLYRFGIVGRGLAAIVAALMYARMTFEDSMTPKELHETNASTYVVLARLARA